ncbi:relaxin receptor 2-like [Littorina saxatilis]|uniref:relaxin receptor 2-like n=1 Tax=Littorina saxatilis TaxID=31220 RepID=UPI0038B47674
MAQLVVAPGNQLSLWASSSTGFVQPFGWKPDTPLMLQPNTDLWGRLDIPVDRYAVVSLKNMMYNTLGCERMRDVTGTMVDVYASTVLEDRNLFSTDTLAPQLQANHQWNCSVPDWSDFQQHFACNMDVECEGGRDESDCLYNLCGTGDVSSSDTCYFMTWPAQRWMTSDEASDKCQRGGGHLATPTTPVEWRTVTEALRVRKQMVSVFVGLTTATSIALSISADKPDKQPKAKITLHHPRNRKWPVSYSTCSERHTTFSFLSCDSSSREAYVSESIISGSARRTIGGGGGPYFRCDNEVQRLPYTLLLSVYLLYSVKCIPIDQLCNGQNDCYNGEDELECISVISLDPPLGKYVAIPPPAVVHFDPTANTTSAVTMTTLIPSSGSYTCPDTHFQCPGGGYCMPVFVRCNGVNDCPGHEDEEGCDTYTCPGFYRCRNSRICLHADHVCDGLYHCPLQDDERYCHIHCPTNCTCYGFAFTCPRVFPVLQFPDLRYLDASDSGVSLQHLTHNVMLIHLGVARCGLTDLGNVTLPNLQSLDLSDNQVVSVSTGDLSLFPNLRELYLSGNPLTSLLPTDAKRPLVFPLIHTLDVSRVYTQLLNADTFTLTPNLKMLNLSHNGIGRIDGTFTFLQQLAVLDIRRCPVRDFQRKLLSNLENLERMYTENYKLCCPVTLPPSFNPNNCLAPFSEVSSCESLLRSDLYRVLLSLFAALALLGNVGSLVIRLFFWKQSTKSGFGTFVSHLCVSDFVMGVYLAIIGLADRLYQGSYLWEDNAWRHSAACKVAGFLSLLACEVSAFIVCFITLDRFLALRFPFSGFHFSNKASHVACTATWLLGVGVAAVPLLPATSHWQFYSQTGICIPLPVTRNDFTGRSYSFGVMIVLNFVLFALMAVGQVFIYTSIQSSRISLGPDSSRKEQDVNIARRLITIAVTDFLCWFPIGLLGLLAAKGVAVPGEVNVALAILVLPLNSALNPFLYSLNMLLERRRRAREIRLLQALEAQLLSEN